MAIRTPDSIELEEQQGELRTILASAEFARAPRLAALLAYLCERLFAGETSQIKEYSIGVEVFQRGTSFDQNSDSIVRVEANRLRKRLAMYYAGEGCEHRFRISIPVGQYVPKFVLNGANGAPGASDSSSASEGKAEKSTVHQLIGNLSRGLRKGWPVGLAVLVLVVLAYTWRNSRQQEKQRASDAKSNDSATRPINAEFGPPAGQEIRILAGAKRSFVDHAGKLWNPDAWYTGGTDVKSGELHIWRTQEQNLFRTTRQGQFRYDIPLKKGVYELRLHFAETVFDPESTATGGEGSRIMTVRANGKSILSGFDIVADAGASRTADVKVFPDMGPAPDGKLHLEFSGDNGVPALLSAIEILPGVRGRMLPVRVLPRQTPYYSNDSRWWSPDNYFEGGQMAAYNALVSGTDDAELYETDRWGNFTYAIPVSPGRYNVTLYFAVRHDDPDQLPLATGESKAATARIFNVFCNGKALLDNFDLAKETREKDVIIEEFKDLEPNAQGKLLLSFVPVEGYATVSGIEVLPR